jgi:hypothetical protein
MSILSTADSIRETTIDVVDDDASGSEPDHRVFSIRRDLRVSTAALETYAFADYEPLVFDAMVVAAAIEYADRLIRRPQLSWSRRFALRIPVHEPERWNAADVLEALTDAVEFLTGDYWTFDFVRSTLPPPTLGPERLPLAPETQAVIAYSDGLDSRAVAGLVGSNLGSRLIKVRLGTVSRRTSRRNLRALQFAGVPYDVRFPDRSNKEPTSRHRGFKFAMLGGIAAYLAHAGSVVIPESGQGAIGPALVTVAHGYPDYRNHPLFTRRMERLFAALFGRSIRFAFPRLWHTKAETLREYLALPSNDGWSGTRSCWQGNQWATVKGKRRQCGVCAACLLRRMSAHAAGVSEARETYVATDLTAATLEGAFDPHFKRTNAALREYAHAGILHLDHLADMADDLHRAEVRNHAALLAAALKEPLAEIEAKLRAMLTQHAAQWRGFVGQLGESSFIAKRAGMKL